MKKIMISIATRLSGFFMVMAFKLLGTTPKEVEEMSKRNLPVEKDFEPKLLELAKEVYVILLKEQAKRGSLAFLLDVKTDEIHKAVIVARKLGLPILANSDGYYVANSSEEINAFIVKELDSRIDDLLMSKVAMQSAVTRYNQYR